MNTEKARPQRKRRDILETAMPVFLKRGYQATSMAEIAAVVGGSKQTLYRHFSSKEALFLAVVDKLCTDIILLVLRSSAGETDSDLKSVLHRLGTQFLGAMNTPEIIAFRRITIAEGAYCGLGCQIYENGVRRSLQQIADVFDGLMARGRMKAACGLSAARQFAALCECGALMDFIAGARGPLSEAEIMADVDSAVSVFVSHYDAV